MQLLFTVITANFNSGEKLKATAESVLSQGVALEYLIVDGASKDQSLALARQLAAEHPDMVRVISEPDRGIYDAMNKGVALARGRYLYFIGAGDELLPGALREVEKSLPSHDRGFVYGDVLWDGERYDGPFDWWKLYDANICHQAIFYGRQTMRKCGPYDEQFRICADWDLNQRCFGRGEVEKKYLPLAIAKYEGGGFSENPDVVFSARRWERLRKNMGWRRFLQRWAWQKKQNLMYRLRGGK